MTKRRKKRVLRPRTPSRVKRRKRAVRQRSHHHPELIGLGLTAVGLFLSTLVYLDWEGGRAGGWIADGIWEVIGDAGYLLPAVCVIVGALMLGRSAVVELRPFRTGLVLTALGLMLVLGDHGGYVGRALDEVVGTLVGRHQLHGVPAEPVLVELEVELEAVDEVVADHLQRAGTRWHQPDPGRR